MKIVYFIYFILNANYSQVSKSIRCQRGKHNCIKLILDALWCSLYFGTSLNDYFNFRFYEKKRRERSEFSSTLYMYKFHKALNNTRLIDKVEDKSQFRKYFKKYAPPSEVFVVINSEGCNSFISWLAQNNYKKAVLKDPLGTTGKSILIFEYFKERDVFLVNNHQYRPEAFCNEFSIKGKIYIEPFLEQHTSIQSLAPSALNTIRIITVLNQQNEADIISAAFRISLDGQTDNFSTGNLAAAIDIDSGIVISPGIKRMAACSSLYDKHPITGKTILGFQIPLWKQVVSSVKEAAVVIPEVRTVGWDVAILEDKVLIIEGNPKWNKGAPQIPLDKGIKPILDKYLEK